MQSLILMSVLIATFAIPSVMAGGRKRSGYGRVLGTFFVFTGVYVFLLLFIYPRLF